MPEKRCYFSQKQKGCTSLRMTERAPGSECQTSRHPRRWATAGANPSRAARCRPPPRPRGRSRTPTPTRERRRRRQASLWEARVDCSSPCRRERRSFDRPHHSNFKRCGDMNWYVSACRESRETGPPRRQTVVSGRHGSESERAERLRDREAVQRPQKYIQASKHYHTPLAGGLWPALTHPYKHGSRRDLWGVNSG